MKKIYLMSLLVFCLFSCKPDLINFEENSHWIVLEVVNKNKLLQVNSLDAKGLIYQINNNDFETVKFNTIDSTVILPGFKSKRIKYKFKILNDSISLNFVAHKITSAISKPQFDNSIIETEVTKINQLNNIYDGIYRIEINTKKTEILLSSKSTIIRLKSVESVINEAIYGVNSPLNNF